MFGGQDPIPAARTDGIVGRNLHEGRREPPFPFEIVMVEPSTTAPSPWTAGLAGRCPRCGQGRLFNGFLSLNPRCESCGLDLGFADSADGPAFFIMSIVGILVVGLALVVEFTYEPPIWLHLVTWSALAVVLSLALARPTKGLLIALQYHHRAAEGRLER
jgi:uncharacterized protein (DUF983 family)